MIKGFRAIARELLAEPYDYGAPALKFERLTGLTGIHVPWRMPNNETPASVERRYFEDLFVLRWTARTWYCRTDRLAYGRAVSLFDTLLSLNSGLQCLQRFRMNAKLLPDALLGITSQFNTGDILHFLLVPTKEYNLDPHLTAATASVEARSGARLFWKPSPATLAAVWLAMDQDPRYALNQKAGDRRGRAVSG